jgi:eukaryotic-like serine/threonine-protein kinase
VHQVLARMDKPDSTRLDVSLAREVAVREGIKAVIAGEVNRAGGQFVVSARLLTADSGAVLAVYRETADDSTEIIGAVDRLSKRLRGRIGESLRTVRQSPPLEQLTTRSLEALRKYAQAKRLWSTDGPRAVAFLDEAIALDSGFASAYRALGILLGNFGEQRERQIVALTKAFQHRERLPSRERYLAASSYHAFVTGERDKARADLHSLLDLFPQDPIGLNNLGVEYQWIRDDARAAELFGRGIAADSSNILFFINLSNALFAQGLGDSAAAIIGQAERQFPRNPLGTWYQALLFSSRLAYDSSVSLIKPLAQGREPDPTWRTFANSHLANVAAVRGQLSEATRRAHDAMQVEEERGAIPNYVQGAAQHALRLVALGESRGAVREVEAALRRHPLKAVDPTDRPYLDLVEVYAATGKVPEARALLTEYERTVPVAFRRNDEPERHIARGMIALYTLDTATALAEFQAGDQGACRICALPGLAQAYELAGQPDSALAAWTRYLTSPYLFRIFQDAMWLPRAYFRLAELYERRGDRATAVEYYGRFAALWKDADPLLQPRVSQAKERRAVLTAEP